MTHIFIDADKLDWSGFLSAQGGSGKYFVGTKYQRGFGLFTNTILPGISKFLMPIAKNLMASAGQEGLSAGTKILGDLSQGKDMKETLAEHSRQSLQNLATKLQQCGKGKKQKRVKQIPPNMNKRKYNDQLSLF
jgi:hypothetical protein